MPVEDSFVFAHLADAHVGAWPRDAAVRRALRASVLRALEVVEERDCRFLLVSGDLFHSPVPEPAEVMPIASALRSLVDSGRRVYVIYGSHDYIAHRTSWLDVLAETGIFLRAAPEAVRAEGERWTLPFLTDTETGAAIAGLSGRAHGLDRSYFAQLDTEAFRAHRGFKIFQFHAAVQEYLPDHLREHVRGVSRRDLPGGVDYYAGGHIHYTYEGEGPEGGLLVNPGAVFGTSVTDLENGARGRTRQGLVVVTVREGVPEIDYVETAPKGALQVFDVDVSGQTAASARTLVDRAVAAHAAPGALLFPRLRGTLADGSLGDLGLREVAPGAAAEAIHWDLRDADGARPSDDPGSSEDAVEREALRTLLGRPESGALDAKAARDLEHLEELLHVLSVARADGEVKHDYENARIAAALRALGLASEPAAESRT